MKDTGRESSTTAVHDTFTGTVTDPFGKPLADSLVELVQRPGIRVRTDREGRFSISIPPGEPFLLKITRAGSLPLFVSRPDPGSPVQDTRQRYVLYPDGENVAPTVGKGGPVEIEADRFGYEEDHETYLASGNVYITYDSTILVAETVRIDRTTDEAAAEGHVLVLGDGDILEGDRGFLKLQAKTGVIYDGRLFLAKNHMYVRGDRIEKRAEATYWIENASATPCDGDTPDWRFTGRELDVTLDGYGKLYHGRFEVRKQPVIYTPFLMFPVKTTRQSGFLLPYMSYSRDKLGVDVQVPFYWAAAKNIDATLYTRVMTQRGTQEGLEVRYVTAGGSFGTIYGDFLDDRKRVYEDVSYKLRDWQPGQSRWALWWNHETRFENQSYIRADIAKVSDSWYFRDFSSHNYFLSSYSSDQSDRFRRVSFLANESLPQLDSTVRYVKDWANANLTAAIRYTDDFTKSTNATTLQRYPEISFTTSKQQILKTPLYYELGSVYDYFYRNTGQKGHLLDIRPTISMPMTLFRRIQFTPSMSWEGTFWSRDDDVSLTTDTRQGERQLFQAGATFSSEVQKIFDINLFGVDKVRHAIKPEVTYTYIPNVSQTDIPDFAASVSEKNTVTYALTNTLTARRKDRKTGKTTYQEWVRLKLAQTFDIIEAKRTVELGTTGNRPFSVMDMELDLTPISYLNFAARNKLDVSTGGWKQTNYDLTLSDVRGDSITAGYRYTKDTLEELNLTLKAVITPSLDVMYVHRRNRLDNKDVERTYSVQYRRQCWEIKVSFSDNVSYLANGVEEPDRVYAVKLSLYGL
ncbi:MAG: LPS assembly protein LptD [Syntrophaceae bacterium]|nr:LPS assembly protein LptD [Syntrophaceae bacterium]